MCLLTAPMPNIPVELTAHSAGFVGVPGLGAVRPRLTSKEVGFAMTVGGTVTKTLAALTLALALLTAPIPARAQPAGIARIGWLGLPSQAANADLVAGFREGLREFGYTEGRNLAIEYRFAEGRSERLANLAVELVGLPVSAIVVTSAQAAIAAKPATATIPIVLATVGDPVGTGLIASLAKPGGNVTGVSSAQEDFSAKLLGLLREVVPGASLFAYLDDLDSPIARIHWKNIQVRDGRSACRCRSFPSPSPMLSSPN